MRLGANKYSERQPIGTAAQGSEDKDYKEPPPARLFEPGELKSWSFYRAGIAEFMATFLFLYVTILTVMGYSGATSKCATVGIQGTGSVKLCSGSLFGFGGKTEPSRRQWCAHMVGQALLMAISVAVAPALEFGE